MTVIRKRFRHMNRYREIAMTLAKHGFGYILEEIGLFHLLSLPKRLSTDMKRQDTTALGKKIRLTLEDLGPTFIKFGQILSTRRDILPGHIIEELEHLQDRIKPFEFEECKRIIEESLGAGLEELFQSFDPEPLAAASIGQVHKATLRTGEAVAVKVKRPGIDEKVRTDLDILRDLSRMAEKQFDWAKNYKLRDILEEFAKSIKDELDFSLEGMHTEKIARQFSHDENIVVPGVYWEMASESVLTLEFIEGYRLSELNGQFDKKLLAHRIVQCFFQQIFDEGFFHGDPHPGNILFLPGNKVALLDFGQVGRLSKEMRFNFSSLVIALMKQDVDMLIRTFIDMSLVSEEVNHQKLRTDMEFLNEKYYDIAFSDIHVGEVINDFFKTAQRHRVVIPVEYTILGKALITVESVAEDLDPELSILKIAEPYGKRLMMERYHPSHIAENLWDDLREYQEIAKVLPKQSRDLLRKLNKGRFVLNMNFPDTEKVLFKMDRISNRISFSITLLAFSIIMVGMIIGASFGQTSSFLTKLPVIEISFVVSFLMFIWLLLSIFKSGRF